MLGPEDFKPEAYVPLDLPSEWVDFTGCRLVPRATVGVELVPGFVEDLEAEVRGLAPVRILDGNFESRASKLGMWKSHVKVASKAEQFCTLIYSYYPIHSLYLCHRGGWGCHGCPTFWPPFKENGDIFKPRYAFTQTV